MARAQAPGLLGPLSALTGQVHALHQLVLQLPARPTRPPTASSYGSGWI